MDGWGGKLSSQKQDEFLSFFTNKYQLHSYSTLISYYEKENLLDFFFCPSLLCFNGLLSRLLTDFQVLLLQERS